MTIQGAMQELVHLLNADDIPIYYKGVIEKVIETIDDYIEGKDDYIKRKIELQTIVCVKDHGRKQALEMIDLYHKLKTEEKGESDE